MTERYRIYNPGDTPAAVVLTVPLDEGSADPFKLAVAPHSVATVTTSNESRIPKGVGHSAILYQLQRGGGGGRADRRRRRSVGRGRIDRHARKQADVGLLAAPGGGERPQLRRFGDRAEPRSTPGPAVAILGIQKGQDVPLEGLSGLAIPAGGRCWSWC